MARGLADIADSLEDDAAAPAKVAPAKAAAPKRPAKERRKRNRWQYDCVQRIAPYDGENLPPIESFRLVRCFDLSTTGISYLSLTEPTYRQVVIALSDFERTVYATARVCHWRPGFGPRKQHYLVGCQFHRRVRYLMD